MHWGKGRDGKGGKGGEGRDGKGLGTYPLEPRINRHVVSYVGSGVATLRYAGTR